MIASVTRLRLRSRRFLPGFVWRTWTAWRHDGPALPDLPAARERLAGAGRLSWVRHPSAAHRAGGLDPSRAPSRAGPRLRPPPPRAG